MARCAIYWKTREHRKFGVEKCDVTIGLVTTFVSHSLFGESPTAKRATGPKTHLASVLSLYAAILLGIRMKARGSAW